MVEERPFESLFFTDHTHIPAVARDPVSRPATELPREYSRIHDPFVALMAAGAATERIKLGTGVCLVVERDPIVTAKAGRERRPADRRPAAVRRRRRLEPRGDAKPRHRPGAALLDPARAGRGDQGDLDLRRGHLPRRARRLRPHLVLAEAARPSPTRRSSSAATASGCSTGCSPSATSGCRTGSATTPRSAPGSRACARPARTPAAGRSRPRSPTRPPTPRCSSSTRTPACTGRCSGSRQGDESDLERRLDRLAAGIEAYESAG